MRYGVLAGVEYTVNYYLSVSENDPLLSPTRALPDEEVAKALDVSPSPRSPGLGPLSVPLLGWRVGVERNRIGGSCLPFPLGG